ncbi:MAG: hypothetical protein ACOCV2_12410 [Persicimonas sp.]
MGDSLITVVPSGRRLDPSLLEAEGGFLWWYLDLVDEQGDGLVLIWSFGLPFLPGYADAARRGCAPAAGARPSLNLSVYRQRALDFYLLREFDRERVAWHPDRDRWKFGETEIRRELDDDRVQLHVELDCAVTGCAEPITGEIHFEGARRKTSGEEEAAERGRLTHDWSPQSGPASARARLRQGGRGWDLSGRAYHDRNGGSRPLHDLGIDVWIWGRAPLPDRELIYYLLWGDGGRAPVCVGMTVDEDGTTDVIDDLDVVRRGRRRNLGGLTWWEELELSRGNTPWARVRHRTAVDSGPFYMRYLTEVSTSGAPPVVGIGELCEPDRVDLKRHRPLVRMRVDRAGDGNSMWLPLFSGPREGRLGRLVSNWLSGGRR